MNDINWTYRARALSVTDGDTVKLLIDLGFYTRGAHAIRLKDVNAPEIFTKDAEEKAKGFAVKNLVEEWLETSAEDAVGSDSEEWPLILVTQKDKQTFNRYIGEIFCAECGDSLNEYLKDLGYT